MVSQISSTSWIRSATLKLRASEGVNVLMTP